LRCEPFLSCEDAFDLQGVKELSFIDRLLLFIFVEVFNILLVVVLFLFNVAVLVGVLLYLIVGNRALGFRLQLVQDVLNLPLHLVVLAIHEIA